MHIDLIFDASFCPNKKFGTYSFYVKNGKSFSFSSSGRLKSCNSPSEAEIMALINALHAIKKSSLSGKIGYLTIHSDCMNIFGKVTNKTENELGTVVMKYINEILNPNLNFKRKRPYYRMQHVKAHTGSQDEISRLNEYCHNQAKIQLQLRRQEIDEENTIFSEEAKSRREVPAQLPVDSRNQSDEQRKLQVPLRSSIKKRNNVSQKL